MTTTRVYDREDCYCCTVVKRYNSYEIVFPPEVTLKSVHKSSIEEVHQWLDKEFGKGLWVLKKSA